MIRRLSIITIFIIAIISFSNCSGKKKLEKGEYSAAVYKSVNKLRNSPSHKKASSTLTQAYPLALDYINRQIDIAKKSNEPFKWNKVVDQMQLANSMEDEISRCPACRSIITTPTRFDNELTEAKNKAAEECYTEGLKNLDKGSRLSAQDAYFLFIKADKLVSNYKDVNNLIPQAKELGTLKVVLEQIPVGAKRLEISAQFFQNNIEAFIHDLFKNKLFVALYLPKEAEEIKLVPDQIIRIQFDDFIVGQERIKESIMTLTSKDSVEVGTYKKNDSTNVIIYNLVTANYRELTKEIISEGLVDVKIIEFNSNKILLQNKFPGSYVWVNTWAVYNGDQRALSRQQLALTKERELAPPPSQDLFVEFTKPIYTQVTDRLKSFYSAY